MLGIVSFSAHRMFWGALWLLVGLAAAVIWSRHLRRYVDLAWLALFAWWVVDAALEWKRGEHLWVMTAMTAICALLCGCAAAAVPASRWRRRLRDRVRTAKAAELAGTVRDDFGLLFGALVEECSADWKERLAETRTDDHGRFRLAGALKGIHYLRFSWPGLSVLRVQVRLSADAGPLIVRMRPRILAPAQYPAE